MQTFLPYPEFEKSLRVLDDKRLGNQRKEASQILSTVYLRWDNPHTPWANHPAILMWSRYPAALAYYFNCALLEWERRGFKNTHLSFMEVDNDFNFPRWLGDERLHSSHRSNLLRKDPTFYSRYGWQEECNLAYFWPVENYDAPLQTTPDSI